MPLDVPTLFVVATCVTGLLGIFLLVLWMQDKSVRALGWWAVAYLIGGVAVAIWLLGPLLSISWANEIANALLFVACGMIWNGARSFHGRRMLVPAMFGGAVIWLIGLNVGIISDAPGARVVFSSLIIAAYAVLTAIELKRERRNQPGTQVRAFVMPLLHGAVFLSPILTTYLLPGAARGFGEGFFALFALLTLLYVVGTAFIIVVMAKERSLLVLKTAALTDPLTGLFNRRGFFEGAQKLIEIQERKKQPVTVLMFDLDHFKSINDRFGHDVGDDVLRAFATTASTNMRTNDIIGRLGGEEFAAILPSGVDVAVVVADRVRMAFEAAGVQVSGRAIGATVSIGAACATESCGTIPALLASADRALYQAKSGGRNRVVADSGFPGILPDSTPSLVPEASVPVNYRAAVSL